MDVSLRIASAGWQEAVAAPDGLCRRAVKAAAEEADRTPAGAIDLLLTDDKEIARLNRTWRNKEGPTNVLSFPDGESEGGGDIAIALETVQREAAKQGRNVDDHLAHLVVHGVLHLLGDRHDTDAAAERMERREVAALARIGVANPYGAKP